MCTIKYKNRTYVLSQIESTIGNSLWVASFIGYEATGKTMGEALENCHQMIEDDFRNDEENFHDDK